MTRQSSLTDFITCSSTNASFSKPKEASLISSNFSTTDDSLSVVTSPIDTEFETESDSNEEHDDGSLVSKHKKLIYTGTGHHRKRGFDPKWLKEFTWLEKIKKDGRVGMLCKKHCKIPRNGKGGWSTEPCFTTRRDKLVRHAVSRMHRGALVVEAEHSSDGIQHAFQDVVTLEMKAVIGCCKCIHFLCKQEISHTTTYPHLLTLVESLGCEYFRVLNIGRNAKYTSPQIVAEFLEVLNDLVEEKVLRDIKASSFTV